MYGSHFLFGLCHLQESLAFGSAEVRAILTLTKIPPTRSNRPTGISVAALAAVLVGGITGMVRKTPMAASTQGILKLLLGLATVVCGFWLMMRSRRLWK